MSLTRGFTADLCGLWTGEHPRLRNVRTWLFWFMKAGLVFYDNSTLLFKFIITLKKTKN